MLAVFILGAVAAGPLDGLTVDTATAARADGRSADRAARDLRPRLARGELPLGWIGPEVGPGARFAPGPPPALHVFDRGRFVALDPATGRTRWAARVGVAEPRLWSAGRRALVLTSTAVLALDGEGHRVWHRAVSGAFAPLAIAGDRACAAGPETLRCWELPTGRELWSRPLPSAAIGGPVVVGAELLLPTAGHLEIWGRDRGERRARVRVDGGWSAPIVVSPAGDVWLFTARRGVRRFDRRLRRVGPPSPGPRDMAWPPRPLLDRVVIGTGPGSGSPAWVLDPQRGLVRWRWGGEPIAERADPRGTVSTQGATLLAHRPNGDREWRARLPAAPTRLAVGPDWIAAANAKAVWLVDGRTGQIAGRFRVPEGEISDLTWDERGGAVIAKGRVLGLLRPDDPRLARLRAYLGTPRAVAPD